MWGALASSVALAVVGIGVLGGRLRPKGAPSISAAAALLVAVVLGLAWITGNTAIVDVPWMTPLGSRLALSLDPLGAPLAVFVTAIAAPILAYTGGYLPPHLAEGERPITEQARFCALLLVFMAAMVLLVIAHDLVVLFVALELTALTSFLLIEFDREVPEARRAAMVALVVTVGSSLVFLVGLLLISAEVGSTRIADASAHRLPPLSLACLVIGALGKSAQVPLHFWLPRAMVAPTPVSAYLHSAALVAAGVFVLMRVRVLLASSPAVLDALVVVGFVSISVGGVMALVQDELKGILAYSTIAQYGYALVLIGLGGSSGLAGAPFFIVAHGVCKSALFLTAGALKTTTGAEKLSELGGLARSMPLLAVSSGVATAGLAGLPLTIGYFKDEVLLAAASEHGAGMLALATAAIAVTLAYSVRFWVGIFLGAPRSSRPPARRLSWPVALLAVSTVLGGVFIEPLRGAFEEAGRVVAGHSISFELHYQLGTETMWALGGWALGALIFATRARWEAPLHWLCACVSELAAPSRVADGLASLAGRSSRVLHRLEVRDLRDRIGAVLVPTALLVGLAIASGPGLPDRHGVFGGDETPLIAALVVMSLASVIAARPARHFAIVLQLSFVGFALALTFALVGAPEVALVIVLIETLFTLLFLGVLSRIRPEVLRRTFRRPERGRRPLWMALAAGLTVFVVTWGALATPKRTRVPDTYLRLTEHVHAGDAVTAVLADFRGFDTAGELTVLAVAILGAVAVARGSQP